MQGLLLIAGLATAINALAVTNGTATTSAAKSKCTAKCQMNACYAAINSASSAGLQDCSSFIGTSTIYQTVIPAVVTEVVQATITPATTTLYSTLVAQNITTTFSTFTQIFDVTSTILVDVTQEFTDIITIDELVTVTSTQFEKRQASTPALTASSLLPSYASSACSNPSAYQSVCSCLGISTQATTTVTQTQVALTSTVTLVSTAEATDFETISPTDIISAIATAAATSYIDEFETEVFTDIETAIVTATQTTLVVVSPPTGNAYCENGAPVNGLSAPCTQAGCSTTNLRIEGASDTIYEGVILAGPRNITTASGGTHLCDGTNNNANPVPFDNGISTIDAASQLCGFTYDGTFSSQFDDFFIQRIAGTQQSGYDFWGILNNYAFTAAGGCETEVQPTDELLWAFNAFNVNFFLRVEPTTTPVVLAPGESTTFTVQGTDGNGGGFVNIPGASFNGQTSDGAGNVPFTAPTTPGTYRYKATRSDSIRSNAVTIVVQG